MGTVIAFGIGAILGGSIGMVILALIISGKEEERKAWQQERRSREPDTNI